MKNKIKEILKAIEIWLKRQQMYNLFSVVNMTQKQKQKFHDLIHEVSMYDAERQIVSADF